MPVSWLLNILLSFHNKYVAKKVFASKNKLNNTQVSAHEKQQKSRHSIILAR